MLKVKFCTIKRKNDKNYCLKAGYFTVSGLKLYEDTENVSQRRIDMPQEKNQKQSRRESTNTYVVNPQKSADPPQPQGKNCNCENSKQRNNNMK